MKKLHLHHTGLLTMAGLLAACGGTTSINDLSGTVVIDGSSTVYPIMEAVVEEFAKGFPNVDVSIAFSGTGGGFAQFAVGNTDLSNASRPIKSTEAALAETNGINYQEFLLAYDGLTVVVSENNDWLTDITLEELRTLWLPEGDDPATDDIVETNVPPTRWNQIRASWPNQPITLYGPGTSSGTFDFFTEVITKEVGNSRTDYQPSEDDNVLVQGVAASEYALGYFGFAYYIENTDKLNAVAIKNSDSEDGVIPSLETIADGTYTPLSRPLFTYLNIEKFQNNEALREFMTFMVDHVKQLTDEVGYVSLPETTYQGYGTILEDLA
ncbi:MAG TPA: hypothetical protein DCM23_01475 [Firmicutes bacterium]|nr:hypothetical protein [Bacillota bacterium]